MKLCSKILTILVPVFLLTCKGKPNSDNATLAVKPNYLSDTWVKKKLMEVDADIEKQKIASQATEEFLQKGISFYKAKQDLEAIVIYEVAIESYPTGEVYYHYGNSLANLNRLKDSIKAYKISLFLKPKRPELASYNIACAYSRLGDIYEAYSHLADSVDWGYNAFAHIEKDPDMKNLRAEPDWKNKINGLILSSKYRVEDLYGVFRLYHPKIRSDYYLCRNREIVIAFGNYPGCEVYTDRGYRRGRWELKNGAVLIQINAICPQELIPDENAKENPETQYCIGYQKRSLFRECKKENYSFLLSDYEIKRAIRYEEFQRLSLEQEPKQCDPNFVPKTLEDLSF